MHTNKQLLNQMIDRQNKEVAANKGCHNHVPWQSNPAELISLLFSLLSKKTKKLPRNVSKNRTYFLYILMVPILKSMVRV